MCLSRLIALLLLLLAGLRAARAHGDLHEQITRVTAALAGDSNSIPLLLQRGELHRLHQAWGEALADFQQVKELDPRLVEVDFYRGRTLFEAGHPRAAVACLDQFLARETGHAEAWLTRARTHARLGNTDAAAKDYAAALRRLLDPQPDHFVEYARTLAASGATGPERALQALDDGMRRLGPLVALQEEAIALELSRQRFDPALARLEAITARANRKEIWLARRGELLEQARRPSEARAAYREALNAWERLPGPHRETPAMVELERTLRHRLDQMDGEPSGAAAAAAGRNR
jgi:tetratricopeptide (TPR) repeat protein